MRAHSSFTHTQSQSAIALTETTGEVFADSIIELVRGADDTRPDLLLYQDGSKTGGPRVEYRGTVYAAPPIEPTIARSLTLAAGSTDYGTTVELFNALQNVLVEAGFAAPTSDAATCFVLGSWFADLLPEPPCLVITGARPESIHLLEILACLTRHSLPPLLAPRTAALASLFACGLSPTILINAEALPPHKLAALLLEARFSVPTTSGRIVSMASPRGIFVGESSDSLPFEQPLLMVDVVASNGSLPVVTREVQRRLASEFQPRLLEYRLRNLAAVRDSEADFPGAPTAIRLLARIVGACIVDAPTLGNRVRGVLEHQRQIHAHQRWLDPRLVALEAALARSHEPKRTKIRIGELTDDVIALLDSRGRKCDLVPRRVGAMLTAMGIISERLRDGYTVHFSHEMRQKLHRLAKLHGIAVTAECAAKCPECLASITAASGSRGGKGER